jgi:hypothetical protein
VKIFPKKKERKKNCEKGIIIFDQVFFHFLKEKVTRFQKDLKILL